MGFETSNPLRRAGRPVRKPVRGPPGTGQAPQGQPQRQPQGPGQGQPLYAQRGSPAPVSRGPMMGQPPMTGPMAGQPQGHGSMGPGNGQLGQPGQSQPTTTGGQGEEYKEFHLRACTAQELHDSRYHMVKFQSRKPVDIDKQFTPPIRFQRKDPKNLQMTIGDAEEEEEKERGRNPFLKKRKTHQVLGGTDAEGEAARRLRQEEHYPWVMEDFDNTNAWVSSYEAAQSDTYVVFVFDSYGFKMIPVEKWYRMNSRNKYASLPLEQAEERMQKKDSGHNRWIMDRLQTENGGAAPAAAPARRMRTVEGGEERMTNGEEMDYDEEFADDEEAPLLDGPEEELKEVQERIKKEQLQATHPGVAKEEEDDDLFGDDQEIDKQGKKLRRYLRSLEKNAYYDSDDDENPYASQSDHDSEPEIKQEPDQQRNLNSDAPPLVVFRRKNIKNLPHGMVVVQLPGSLLRRFPEGEWNPRVKRREVASEGSSVGVGASASASINSGANSPVSPGSPRATSPGNSPGSPSAFSAVNASDPTLLTAEDVCAAIAGKSLTISDLISALKHKLKQNKENKDRLRTILKEVAQVRDGKLVLI